MLAKHNNHRLNHAMYLIQTYHMAPVTVMANIFPFLLREHPDGFWRLVKEIKCRLEEAA